VNDRRRALLGLAVAASCAARGGFAAEPAASESIGVVASGCGASLPEVRELPDHLGVELAPRRFEPRSAPRSIEVATSCTAVESVTWRDGNTTRTRAVSLEDVAPELRPVTLAVLTSEFLRSIWATPATAEASSTAALPPEAETTPATTATAAPATATPPPVVKPKTPTPEKEATDAAPPAADRGRARVPALGGFGLGVGGMIRWFASPGTLLAGGELVADTSRFFASLSAVGGDNPDQLGHVTLGVAAGSLGGRLPLLQMHRATLSAIAVVELGLTWASARTPQPEIDAGSTKNFFAAFGVGPELRISLARSLDLALGVRAGAARGLRITGDERDVATSQGFTLVSIAGLRYTL
jgi:hypothetical protein